MAWTGEFQQTAIDHSEVLRRLDTDLASFRTQTETRMAEEGRTLKTVVDTHRELKRAMEMGELPAAAAGGGGGGGGVRERTGGLAVEGRLADVETALLQARALLPPRTPQTELSTLALPHS